MSCTLLIPDFQANFEAAARPRMPALEKMLARAGRLETQGSAALVARLFDLPGDFPVAPFMRLGDGGQPDASYWLCADPVHLAPDRDRLVLMPGSTLQVQLQEVQALAEAFNAIYGADGWHLEFPHLQRGYLRAPKPMDVLTHAPRPFMGGPVLEAMPSGPDGQRLKQLMNETQMLFHTHAVNAAREEAGLPMINSLWFWGAGVLPAATDAAPARIAGDLPLLKGLAKWAGRTAEALIGGEGVQDGDLIGLATVELETLEQDWFAPLLRKLRRGSIRHLDIHLEGLGDFALSSGGARRFWRVGHALGVAR